MVSPGRLTAQIGSNLEKWDGLAAYDVLYDHGPKKDNVGAIVSWFGDANAPERDTEITQLDIAVVDPTANKALVLIEIEETSDAPKTLLGDIFGTLAGDHISFKGRGDLEVGEWTTLIIVLHGPRRHERRIESLVANVAACKESLLGKNRSIGRVLVELFKDEIGLEPRLKELIDAAVLRAGGIGPSPTTSYPKDPS